MPNFTSGFWASIFSRLALPILLLCLALVSTFFVFPLSENGRLNPQERNSVPLYLCVLTTRPTSAWLGNFEVQAIDNYIGHNTFNWTAEVAIKKKKPSGTRRTFILLNNL